MPKHILLVASLALLAAGCASEVQKSDHNAVIVVDGKPGKAIVLNLTGSTVATTAKDWNDFKGLWSEPCTHEAGLVGDTLTIQQGDPRATGDEGTLVVVDVADYRYVSTGARIMLGIMTGNAYINAHVTFRDLKTGDVRTTTAYDTTSSAWNGVFAGMTTKQVAAMCHEIVAEVSR
jgi:Domain of unknown function (DUF4410)